VMQRLLDESPVVVVPGHGDTGGPERLADVLNYLAELRDETWRRRDAGMSEDAAAGEVRAVLTGRHPDWTQPEWIERGVGCLYTEHAA